MSKDKMTVVGYVRVSTENQIENYSIEEQIERITSYCRARDWTLLKIYTDGGYSGGSTDRPALKEMLRTLKTRHIDAVVVYKLDRLSRSQKDTLTLIEDNFLPNSTDFVSINENFDTSTPFGRAMIGILSVFAQLEKDQITERFTMGRIGRSKAGYFHGGGNAPTGYDYIDGQLIVNEYEALQIRQVYDLFLSGRSINAIMRYMQNKYSANWTASKVRNVLTNSLYIGKVHFAGEEYAGIHTPLIGKDTFEEVQRLLPKTSSSPPFRGGYLLSGLIFCAQCGAKYAAVHGAYRCYSRSKVTKKYIKDPNCTNSSWKITVLDTLICGEINKLIAKPTLLNQLLSLSAKQNSDKTDINKLRRRINEIQKQTNRLTELYQVGIIPAETLTTRINALSSERESIEKQILLPEEPSHSELMRSAVTAYKFGFEKADTDEKRLLAGSLIENITANGHKISIKWRV